MKTACEHRLQNPLQPGGEEGASRTRTCLLVACACFAAGCTLTAGVENTDLGTPVKLQPLTGTIDGHAFTAKTAIADPDKKGVMMVTIYTSAGTCDDWPAEHDGDLRISLDVSDWAAGAGYELSSSRPVTFVEFAPGVAHNFAIYDGRVEVTDPGSATASGTLSIRATSSKYGSVEGQVPVVICGK